jgi:hypothetical protein
VFLWIGRADLATFKPCLKKWESVSFRSTLSSFIWKPQAWSLVFLLRRKSCMSLFFRIADQICSYNVRAQQQDSTVGSSHSSIMSLTCLAGCNAKAYRLPKGSASFFDFATHRNILDLSHLLYLFNSLSLSKKWSLAKSIATSVDRLAADLLYLIEETELL